MFNCSVCARSVGPKISPIRVVTSTRPVEYHNEFYVEDEFGNRQKREVDSRGTEIEGEVLVCPLCANAKPQNNNAGFIHLGAHSFGETPAAPMHVKLIANVVQNMLERLDHKSKRAKRDTETVVPNIKQFVDDNKGLVF